MRYNRRGEDKQAFLVCLRGWQMESRFERAFIRELKDVFPGCVVLKLDPGYVQGVPDRLLLIDGFWAVLEFKDSRNAPHQPNQDWYIEKFGEMSFASFVYPENAEDVMYGLQQAYQAHRDAFFSKS
jgi:hypothetical protein